MLRSWVDVCRATPGSWHDHGTRVCVVAYLFILFTPYSLLSRGVNREVGEVQRAPCTKTI